MAKCSTIVLLFCFLFACTSSIAVKHITDIPQAEILVFGEIVATNVKPGARYYDIFIQEDRGGEEIRVKVRGDRHFYWHLRPGSYTITTFLFKAGAGRIWVKFDVPTNCKAVYIGTLDFTISAISDTGVRDNMLEAEQVLKEKFHSQNFVVTKSLIRKETQP